MEEHNNNELLQRFLTYVAFDTQSKSSAKHSPSSPGQMKLALHLQQELIELHHRQNDSFDNMLASFMKESESSLSTLKRQTDGKRGGRGGRRS